MSALVDELGQLLAARGVGDYATDRELDPAKTPITVAGLPATPDSAITITTYSGGPEPDSRNGWEFPRLQVRVRAVDPLDAMQLDRAAYDVLHKLQTQLPSWWLQDSYSLQSNPEPLGRDDSARWEYVRNYQLTVKQGTQ